MNPSRAPGELTDGPRRGALPNPSHRRGLGNGGGWGGGSGWGQGDGGGGGGTAVDEPSVDELRAQDVGEGGGCLAAGDSWRGKERERKGRERRR